MLGPGLKRPPGTSICGERARASPMHAFLYVYEHYHMWLAQSLWRLTLVLFISGSMNCLYCIHQTRIYYPESLGFGRCSSMLHHGMSSAVLLIQRLMTLFIFQMSSPAFRFGKQRLTSFWREECWNGANPQKKKKWNWAYLTVYVFFLSFSGRNAEHYECASDGLLFSQGRWINVTFLEIYLRAATALAAGRITGKTSADH